LEDKPMKYASALGILLSTMVFACAPVASSVPKLAATSPRTGNSVVGNRGNGSVKFDPRIISQTEVVVADDLAKVMKKLVAGGYAITPKYDQHDPEFSAILEFHALKGVTIGSSVKRPDLVVVYVMKDDLGSVPGNIGAEFELFCSRPESNKLDFTISLDGDSGAAWSFVKKNVESFIVAVREAPTKK
jgi:hypothetical protein